MIVNIISILLSWFLIYFRACLENAALMAALEARSEELRKMYSEKMGKIYVMYCNVIFVLSRKFYNKHKLPGLFFWRGGGDISNL